MNLGHDNYVMLPILPVTINDTFHTYALLDTGSSDSFCARRLVDRLNIKGPVTTYELNTIGKTVYQRSEMVNFEMSSISTTIDMKNIRVVNYIPTQSRACDLSEYSHLEGLRCPGNVIVDILIGQDYPFLLRPLEVRSGANGEPFAIRSILGWAMNGPVSSQPTSRRVISNFVSTVAIEEKIDRLWEVDNLDDMPSLSPEDTRVIELWDRCCTVVDGHFELPVPWRNADEILPDNYYLAESRLNSLMKSLEKKEMMPAYDEEIQKMLLNGYAERVNTNSLPSKRCFYLPHHGVTKKEGKLRVVFDCASKCRGISLNSLCLQGPNLTCKLFDVLIRFRRYPHALTSDITSMYNQVMIPSSDRDALRFLWTEGDAIVCYRMTSHLFGGIWCSSSSSYALKKTAELTSNPRLKYLINSAFYVDDLMWSTQHVEDAVSTSQTSTTLQ